MIQRQPSRPHGHGFRRNPDEFACIVGIQLHIVHAFVKQFISLSEKHQYAFKCDQLVFVLAILFSSFETFTFFTFFTHMFNIHLLVKLYNIWAVSSEKVSSAISQYEILNANAQQFRGARNVAFPLTYCLCERTAKVLARAQTRLNHSCSHKH